RIGSAEVTGPIPVSSFEKARIIPGCFSFMLHFVLHDLLFHDDEKYSHFFLKLCQIPFNFIA
ncbi:MAG: hypothetical protein NC314_07975, partial [Roseburia sp.]|nr:hypothetical protein [Roseburia sp.]MCM1242764.1 hypothetical protein [Roseburia sp.]